MKYKSLQQVYSESVRGSIPPRKHLEVYGEAKVQITFDDNRTVEREMPDKEAQKLFGLGRVDKESNAISDWVKSGGWNTNDAIFALRNKINEIYEPVHRNNKTQLDKFYEQVKELTNVKSSTKILRELLDRKKVDDIYVYLNAKLKDRFPLLVNVESLRKIGNIAFSEGNVGVGPGEALLSLFTEGANPEKGDIVLPDGDEVELKASEGRPGKARVAGLVRRFEKFIQKGHSENVVELSPQQIKVATQAIEALKQKVQDSVVKASIDKFDPNNADTIDDVIIDILSNKTKRNIVNKADVNAFNNLMGIRDQISSNKAGATKMSKAWFSTANDQQLIEGLSLFASDDKQQIAKQIISKGLQQGKSMDRVDLALSIAMTFQIAEYYDELKQKFTYYTLFNKDSGLLVTWGPFNSDYATNANTILANILTNRDKINISADSGGRTGYNLSVK